MSSIPVADSSARTHDAQQKPTVRYRRWFCKYARAFLQMRNALSQACFFQLNNRSSSGFLRPGNLMLIISSQNIPSSPVSCRSSKNSWTRQKQEVFLYECSRDPVAIASERPRKYPAPRSRSISLGFDLCLCLPFFWNCCALSLKLDAVQEAVNYVFRMWPGKPHEAHVPLVRAAIYLLSDRQPSQLYMRSILSTQNQECCGCRV